MQKRNINARVRGTARVFHFQPVHALQNSAIIQKEKPTIHPKPKACGVQLSK
jgi:hypothetical protein